MQLRNQSHRFFYNLAVVFIFESCKIFNPCLSTHHYCVFLYSISQFFSFYSILNLFNLNHFFYFSTTFLTSLCLLHLFVCVCFYILYSSKLCFHHPDRSLQKCVYLVCGTENFRYVFVAKKALQMLVHDSQKNVQKYIL